MTVLGVVRADRRPRADGQRNRERLLSAANEVFGQGAGEASLEAVARRAGVGIGTLYRHFPTREALYSAVYEREVGQLAALAESLGVGLGPMEALRAWMRANVEFIATKKGMVRALAVTAQAPSPPLMAQLLGAVGGLMERAVAAGEMRGDVGPEELLRALVGLCYAGDRAGWQLEVLRMVDVLVDGLRVR